MMTYIEFLRIIKDRFESEEKKVIEKVIVSGEESLNDEEIEILDSLLENYKISNCPNCLEAINSDDYETFLFIYDEGMCGYCRTRYDNMMKE